GGRKPAGISQEAETAALQSLDSAEILADVDDEHARMIMQSVGQGVALASDLRKLELQGNNPVNGLVVARPGQAAFNIDGAMVTVIGPLQKRLDKLREAGAEGVEDADQ